VKKRWIQLGLVAVAIGAAGFGMTQVKHRSHEDTAWVATVGHGTASSNASIQSNQASNLPATGNANQAFPPVGGGTSASIQGTSPNGNKGPGTPESFSKNSSGKSSPQTGSPSTNGGQSQPSSAPHPGDTVASPPPAGGQPDLGSFTVVVSEDKGQTLVSKKTLRVVKGESLMAYMHENYDVTTAYGDNFMVAINGIQSQWTSVPPAQRQPVDWFLYINGTSAPAGAGDIVPKAGDVDNWDYHRWDPSTGKG
jgi:hypothetical protein